MERHFCDICSKDLEVKQYNQVVLDIGDKRRFKFDLCPNCVTVVEKALKKVHLPI